MTRPILLSISLTILVLLLLALLFTNQINPLKRCKFNERTGNRDVCFWLWDPALRQPSIYF